MNHYLILILTSLAAFFLGGFTVYFLIRYRVLTILKEERFTYFKEINKKAGRFQLWFLPLVKLLKKRKDHYKAEVGDLITSLEEDKSNLNDYEQNNHELRNLLNEKDRQILELKKLVRGTDENSEFSRAKTSSPVFSAKKLKVNTPGGRAVFYFGIPDSDGNFSTEKGATVLDDRKLYKIITDAKGESGDLHFISGQFDLKAIDNIDYYLMPVCNVENISDRSFATRVLQKEPGKIVKISDKWVIDKKVKVKLI